MSELFLSFCSSPSETGRRKLRDVLAANPGLQRNLLAVISLTENGVLKIGHNHEFSGCRVRFTPPDSDPKNAEEPFFILDTDLDSELSESLARLTPDSVLLTGANIEEARLKAGVSVIVSNAESVQSLFSFIVHIIDSGMVLNKGEDCEEQRVSSSGKNVKKRIGSLMRSLFKGGSEHDDNEHSVLTSVFECYLDYYLERALGHIHAGGYDSNGDSAWELDPRFLHATLNGRALLHDEITTGILSSLHRGQAFISSTWSSQARHRVMLLSAVLRAINELPKNVKDEVRRDSSTRQRSSINFLCACGIAIYASEGRYVSLQNSDIRIRSLLQAMLADNPARYDEAAGMLAISHLASDKKYNKKLIQELMNDARFASVYHKHDIRCSEAQDLLLRLQSRYRRVCDLVQSCGGQPLLFPKFCIYSFFESLLPALERCGGFQLTLPIQIDSHIDRVRQGAAFGQYAPTISDLGRGGANAELLYQGRDADVESTPKFDDVRVRKALIRAVAVFVISAVILGITAILYLSGAISAQVMMAVGIIIGVVFVLSMVGLAFSYAKGRCGLDIARHRSAPMLTLCVSVRDRDLFNDAREQESISGFGIANGKLCMEGRPLPRDKYVAHVLGSEDEVPHGMCILFGMRATRDDGDLELIRTVSSRTAWPEGSTTSISFTECPYMGMDDCNVRCSASGQWSSRAGHIVLMKTLARAGRVNLLLSYLDAYVDLMCSDDGRNAIDPKFRTSKQWKLLCRDHAEHGVITAIYECCGMYIDERRRACLEYVTALLQVHDVSKIPGKKSHSGILSTLQHKYVDKYASNLHRLVNGPEFPFSDDAYKFALEKESGITFDSANWFFSQIVPVQFTRFMCADDRTLIYPQGNSSAAAGAGRQRDDEQPIMSEDKAYEEPQDSHLDVKRSAAGNRPQTMDSEPGDDDILSHSGAGATTYDDLSYYEEEETEIRPNFAPDSDEEDFTARGVAPRQKKGGGAHGNTPTNCGAEYTTTSKMRVNSYKQHGGGAQGLCAGGGGQ
ncbi:MAG: hypothetical protein AB8U34_02255 [Anaplasma ovis]